MTFEEAVQFLAAREEQFGQSENPHAFLEGIKIMSKYEPVEPDIKLDPTTDLYLINFTEEMTEEDIVALNEFGFALFPNGLNRWCCPVSRLSVDNPS